MTGLADYLSTNGTDFSVSLGSDGWSESYEDFITVLKEYINPKHSEGRNVSSVAFTDNSTDTEIKIRISLQYIKLTKESRGEIIDDADRQIDAMDAMRDMIKTWNEEEDLPPSFPYSEKFLGIEGFKTIRQELFRNAGLAILSVGVITFFSLGNFLTAILLHCRDFGFHICNQACY